MVRSLVTAACVALTLLTLADCRKTAAWSETSPHKSGFMTANGVRLNYLDWGGSGTTLLLLTGMGETAHIYDDLAPKFTDRFHVIGLTRRGQGQSEKPETGNDTTTLVEDIRQSGYTGNYSILPSRIPCERSGKRLAENDDNKLPARLGPFLLNGGSFFFIIAGSSY